MANDLFSSLGGLMKGLSSAGFASGDDESGLIGAQSDVADLKNQEEAMYLEIGRKAVEMYGLDAFGELADKLKLIQSNLKTAQAKLDAAKAEDEAKKKAEQEAKAACTCPSCGYENPDGTKFCQECGTKMGSSEKTFCTSCGAELSPGTRFCGECGARQGE